MFLQQQINNLENQLVILKQQLSQASPYQTPQVSQSLLPSDLDSLIQKTIQDEIKKLIPVQPTPQVSEPSPTPVTPATTMEQEINKLVAELLSPEQLTWISKPEIFNGIPLFLKTTKGREAISFLIDEYKTHLS
jgi:hypothetical protein